MFVGYPSIGDDLLAFSFSEVCVKKTYTTSYDYRKIVEYVKTYLQEETHLFIYLLSRHAGAPTEINKGLSNGELSVEGDFLWHVTHTRSGNT